MATANANVKKVLDSLKSKGTIVEEWHDGSEWYRAWSSGFIEQGGVVSIPNSIVQIVMNRAFATNNYSVSAFVDNGGVKANAYQFAVAIESVTTSGFKVSKYNPSELICHWYACGY